MPFEMRAEVVDGGETLAASFVLALITKSQINACIHRLKQNERHACTYHEVLGSLMSLHVTLQLVLHGEPPLAALHRTLDPSPQRSKVRSSTGNNQRGVTHFIRPLSCVGHDVHFELGKPGIDHAAQRTHPLFVDGCALLTVLEKEQGVFEGR